MKSKRKAKVDTDELNEGDDVGVLDEMGVEKRARVNEAGAGSAKKVVSDFKSSGDEGIQGDGKDKSMAALGDIFSSPSGFNNMQVDRSRLSLIVDKVVKARGEYVLNVSVSPMLSDIKRGQKALVIAIRFQKRSDGKDDTWWKPSVLIPTFDAIYEYCKSGVRDTNNNMPEMVWYHTFRDMQGHHLREMSHGPDVKKTVGGFPISILSCYMTIGFPQIDTIDHIKKVVYKASSQLSELVRTNFFKEMYTEMYRQDSGERAYATIKIESHHYWKALREHRLEVSFDESLDSFFMNDDIEEMMQHMFPGRNVELSEYRHVAYLNG